MKSIYLVLAFLAFGSMTMNAEAAGKKKPTKAEIAAQQAEQARKDSLAAIVKKAEAGDAAAMNEVGSWYYLGKNDMKQDYKTALQWYAKSAKAGNVYGIGNMAMCYQYGHGIDADSVRAIQLYEKAIGGGNQGQLEKHKKLAADKNIFSNVLMGTLYQEGSGVKKDLATAGNYYSTAFKLGSDNALHAGVLAYLNSKNFDKAYDLALVGAKKGDLMSTYYTGLLLHDGKGVAEDWDKGANYMMKAADKGMPNAQYQLGNYFKNGQGVAKDAAKAAEYYQKALTGNITGAAWELAEAYRKGEGVKVDFDKALNLYAVAVAGGYQKSFAKMCQEDVDFRKSAFGSYLKGLRLYKVDKNYEEALKQFKAVSKAKRVEGDVMAAVILADKEYAKCNAKKASKALDKLAAQSGTAYYQMALMAEEGNGTEKDMATALSFLVKAVDAGNTDAMNYLGDVRYEGRGVQKDVKAAVDNYLMAYNLSQLDEKGGKRLAGCYEDGLGGLKKDPKKAKEVLKNVKKDAMATLLSQAAAL